VPETPEEQRALADLDEATREVAADELEKVEPKGTGFLGLFARFGLRGKREPAPGTAPGLRDALHDGDLEE
jgi:hypothetical protein